MDIKDIKQLVKLMVDNDLGELEIADGDSKVHLKRGAGSLPQIVMAPASHVAAGPAPAHAAAPPAAAPAAEAAEELIEIKSPMVGTFYAAPSPESEPYARVGGELSPDSVVCIIEAMKVMNEIRAEVAGVIREICVKNAQPVEFGQVLFRVKPA